MSTLPTLLVTPQKAGIDARGGTLTVLLRVQAPPAPTNQKRTPLHLSLVLDRSGSMQGKPLHEAKRCAEYVVSRLTAQDKAAIVVYDNNVETLVPLQNVTSPTTFLNAIRRINDGGSTDLHAGWLQGAQELAARADGPALSRVLLLSDGQANQGLTDTSQIAAQCTELASAGVTTTTIGLGSGFNEELMVAMARKGGGKDYYGQAAEDLYDAFSEELALAEALHSRRLTATVVPGPGVIAELLSGDSNRTDVPLPLTDAAYGAESWLLLRLHYTGKPNGVHSLLSVTVKGEYKDGTKYSLGPNLLELPAFEKATLDIMPGDETVTRRSSEVEAARLLLDFRGHLQRGEKDEAKRVLSEAREQANGNGWVEATVTQMGSLLEQDAEMAKKEAYYMSHKMQTRHAAPGEAAFSADETNAPASAPAFLRRKVSQGKGKTE